MAAHLSQAGGTAAPEAPPEAPPARNGAAPAAAHPAAPAAEPAWESAERVQVLAADAAPEAGAAALALVEALVRALEHRQPVLRAESSLTRLLAVALGRELKLRDDQLQALSLAALLANLGRLALDPGAADEPGAELAGTLQLLERVPLPAGVREAVAHQHEHWDGSGLPDRLAEARIPFPARILAVARGCARLLAEAPADRPLTAAEAADEVQRRSGSRYDPMVAGLLRHVFAQREQHGIGYGPGWRVLVAHPADGRAPGLAGRLFSAGHAAQPAGDGAALLEALETRGAEAVVLGAAADQGEAAAALVREIRSSPRGRAIPVVVVDASSPDQRIELLGAGADICLPPDAAFAEFRAALDALLRRGELAASAPAGAH